MEQKTLTQFVSECIGIHLYNAGSMSKAVSIDVDRQAHRILINGVYYQPGKRKIIRDQGFFVLPCQVLSWEEDVSLLKKRRDVRTIRIH